MAEYGELESSENKAALPYCKAVFWNSPGRKEKNHGSRH
jgi:hypothetical protein